VRKHIDERFQVRCAEIIALQRRVQLYGRRPETRIFEQYIGNIRPVCIGEFLQPSRTKVEKRYVIRIGVLVSCLSR
jgi:hypothetical protein